MGMLRGLAVLVLVDSAKPCQPPAVASTASTRSDWAQSTKCVDVVQGEPVVLNEAACSAAGGGISWCSGDSTCCSTACDASSNCPTGPPTSVLYNYPVPGNVDCPLGTRKYVLSSFEAEGGPVDSVPDCFSDEYQACLGYGGGFSASASGQAPDDSCSASEELQDWQGRTGRAASPTPRLTATSQASRRST